MQCQSCNAENSVTAKFCSSCGNPLLLAEDIKSPSEITISWIASILKSLGYEISDEDQKEDSLLARHAEKPNLLINLKKQFITFMSLWRLKKPGWGQKEKYLSAVNKANQRHWLCGCDLNEEMNSLHITSAYFLSEKVSNRDIVSYLELYFSGIDSIHAIPEIRELG